jgi:hypothetical protein
MDILALLKLQPRQDRGRRQPIQVMIEVTGNKAWPIKKVHPGDG